MKNKFILFLLVLLSFFSCKKDDSNTVGGSKSLENLQMKLLDGVWQAVRGRESSGMEFVDINGFMVFDFVDKKTVDLYTSKTGPRSVFFI